MRIIDTHAHLWDDRYEVDALHIIHDFRDEYPDNIMIAVGTNEKDCRLLAEIDERNVYKAMGIHAQFASRYSDNVFDFIRINKDNIIAIGEIGLDYFYGREDKEAQLILLEKQLALAKELAKPVILHCRDASEDLIKVLDKFVGLKGVVHCFSGDINTAKELISRGYYIGVGGTYTFASNKQLRDIVKELGLAHIVLETDSPYLAPVPFRGKVNRPEYVRYVAKAIALDLGLSEEEVLSITNTNAIKLFNLEEVWE